MKDKIAVRVNNQTNKNIQNAQQECNYSNNYYGDQVCILAQKGDKKS